MFRLTNIWKKKKSKKTNPFWMWSNRNLCFVSIKIYISFRIGLLFHCNCNKMKLNMHTAHFIAKRNKTKKDLVNVWLCATHFDLIGFFSYIDYNEHIVNQFHFVTHHNSLAIMVLTRDSDETFRVYYFHMFNKRTWFLRI